jgi:hypothetical protein
MARMIRNLAWALAICLVAAVLLRLGDQLNVFAKPPVLPDSANLVDRLLASIPYRQTIWPVFLAWNLLFGVALLVLVPLSTLLVRAVAGSDGRMRAAGACLAAGGIIGAVGQLATIGAVGVTISLPYCDCGFKETEVIAQAWTQNLIAGAANWLVNGALILVAVGLAWFGAVLVERVRSAALGRFSWVVGAALIIAALLSLTGALDPLPDLVAVATFGVLVPAWAVWLTRDVALLIDSDPVATVA